MPLKSKPAAGGQNPRTGGDELSIQQQTESDTATIAQNRPRPQARCFVLRDPRTNPQRRPRERQPTERRLRQAAAIHSIGIFPLACLLDEIVAGADHLEHLIEDVADKAEALLLAFTEARGTA